MHVVPPEIGQFTDAINFSLVSVFTLAKHRGSQHPGAVGPCQQIGSAQENSRAFLPGHGFPGWFGCEGRIDSQFDMRGIASGVMAQHMFAFVGRPNGQFFFRKHVFASNKHRNVFLGRFGVGEGFFQR